ncbi:MAG: tandem-95 repeat protein [Sulfuricurvum sp.]|nr:tandem-95 repeat protein [Sulfuricurvum sp.]
MAKVIGLVKSLENGTFFVKDGAGNEHQLQAGEQIHDGDLVYGDANNAKDAQIVVDETIAGAGTLIIVGNDALYFDTSVLTKAFDVDDSTIHINSLNEALATIASNETVPLEVTNTDETLKTDIDTTNAGETATGTSVTDTERTGDIFADRTGAVGDVGTALATTDATASTTTVSSTSNPIRINTAPTANPDNATGTADDALTTLEDTALTIAPSILLANDIDPDGDALTITSVQDAVNGTVALVDGNIVFTPSENYNGPASFTYTISDGKGGTATAIVNVGVTPVNDLPIFTEGNSTIGDDAGVVTEDTVLSTSGVLAINDVDVGESAFQPQTGTVATHGTFSVAANGSWTYSLNNSSPIVQALGEGDTLTDTISVLSVDGTPTTVTITINGTNDLPVAVADSLSAIEDIAVTYTAAQLLGNDTDVDTAHANLTIASVTNGSNGTVVLNNDNTVTFTPTANYSGSASFTYTIFDGALTSDPATVTVNVIPVADAPTLSMSSYSASTNLEEFGNIGAYTSTADVSKLAGGVWYTDNNKVTGVGQIEIGQENTYMRNGKTNNVIELERHAGDASNLYTIIDAKVGEMYTVSFDYAPRTVYTTLDSSVINVILDGNIVKTLNTTTTGFQSYTVVLPVLDAGKHKLEFVAAEKNPNSLGGLLDNIFVASNAGIAGYSIDLSTVTASLVDTDGSEVLSLTMGGIPNGFILSDGSNTRTAMSDGTTVDITGWNHASLSVTAPSGYADSVALKVTATSTETANSDHASTSKTLNVTVLSNTGNDTVLFDPSDTGLDTGAGMDTLILATNADIDFGALGNIIKNIEVIDLNQNGAHKLNGLTVQDVFDMTDSAHTLTIFGDSADTVTLVNPTDPADTAHKWTLTAENVIENGHTLDIYKSGDNSVTLKVEDTTVHTIV